MHGRIIRRVRFTTRRVCPLHRFCIPCNNPEQGYDVPVYGHHFPAVDIDQSVRFVMQHASLEETTKI
jgi:hypothetical protein